MEEFIGDVIGNLQNFFLIYIFHNLKMLKKKKNYRFPIKQTKIAFKETWNT